MACSFGGKLCCDPNTEAANCERLGYPLAPWWGAANAFVLPLGCEPGRGRFLLLRGDLDALDLNALHDLVFHDGKNRVTLKNLVAVRGAAVTPGYRGDDRCCHWIDVADRRLLLEALPIDKAYNVRSSASGYFSATLNAGVAWTWSQMVSDIWSTIGTSSTRLGTYPGLPFTPDGTPEGFTFYGAYALQALAFVLERLSCALRLDPITDTFSIVQIGATDTDLDRKLATHDRDREWDGEWVEPSRARIPEKVRVLFPRVASTPDSTGGSPWYYLDVSDPSGTSTGVEADSRAILYDDQAALGGSPPSNVAALTTRAAERASDYFRRARLTRLHRAYCHAFKDMLPGKLLKATVWRDTSGVVTEVKRYPGLSQSPFPGLTGSEGGTGGSSGGGGAGPGGLGQESPYSPYTPWGTGGAGGGAGGAAGGGGAGGGNGFWFQTFVYLLSSYSYPLTLAGDVTIAGNLTITGPISSSSSVTFNGPVYFAGDTVTVSGNSYWDIGGSTTYKFGSSTSINFSGPIYFNGDTVTLRGNSYWDIGGNTTYSFGGSTSINFGGPLYFNGDTVTIRGNSYWDIGGSTSVTYGGSTSVTFNAGSKTLYYGCVWLYGCLYFVPYTPSNITTSQNDYPTTYTGTDYEWYRLNVTSSADLTGLAGGSDGRQVMLTDIGSSALTLKHQSASSTASNRIITPDGADYVISAGESALLRYDGTTSRWRVIDNLATGGGGSPAGSNGDIQYNNSGSFGGATGISYAGGGGPATLFVDGQPGHAQALQVDQGSAGTAFEVVTGSGNILTIDDDKIGLNGATPVAKGTITGSRGGNAALASLLTYLASRGDITDSST